MLFRSGGGLQKGGIINPNYPGFQHLAHTLVYGLMVPAISDTELTDDDFECESVTTGKLTETNNIINNNNNNGNGNQEEGTTDDSGVDSVNRLDSIENIQKVFYDKPIFNIPLEGYKLGNVDEASTSNSNQSSDEDVDVTTVAQKLDFAANHKHYTSISGDEFAGDFGDEPERGFDRAEKSKSRVKSERDERDLNNPGLLIEKAFEPIFDLVREKSTLGCDLEEVVGKLSVVKDTAPTASKYKYEPNTESPFNKSFEHGTVSDPKQTMADVTNLHHLENLKRHLNEDKPSCGDYKSSKTYLAEGLPYKDTISLKVSDAFLSGTRESIAYVNQDLFAAPKPNETKHMELDKVEPKTEPVLPSIDSNRESEEKEKYDETQKLKPDDVEKFCKEDRTKDDQEKDEDSAVPRKKERVESVYVKKRRDCNQQIGSLITIPRRETNNRNKDVVNRRSVPVAREKKRVNSEILGEFLSPGKHCSTKLFLVLHHDRKQLRIPIEILRCLTG